MKNLTGKKKEEVRAKRGEIEELRKNLADIEDKLKRALADYQNLEKRHFLRQEENALASKISLIDKFLPVLDDLERANEHLKDKGIELIIERFKKVLESESVEEIQTKDQEFNPETMDCCEVVEGEKNKVIDCVLKGYMLEGKLIRSAKVKVGKGTI